MGRAPHKAPKGWMTLRDVANLLGMTYREALDAAQRHEIWGMRVHKPGQDYRFDREEVTKYKSKLMRT